MPNPKPWDKHEGLTSREACRSLLSLMQRGGGGNGRVFAGSEARLLGSRGRSRV